MIQTPTGTRLGSWRARGVEPHSLNQKTPITDGMAVEFNGDRRLDPVLAGVIKAWNGHGLPKGCVSPTGFEDESTSTWTCTRTLPLGA